MASSLCNLLSLVIPSSPLPLPVHAKSRAPVHSLPPPSPSLSCERGLRYSPITQEHSYSSFYGESEANNGLLWSCFPSLASANVLWFKSGHYNVQVVVGEDEPEEVLLRRFRREVMKAGVVQECKRRMFFENKHAEKKRKAREAAKRNRKWRPQARRAPPPDKVEPSKKKEDEEDNWDLPEGELPY